MSSPGPLQRRYSTQEVIVLVYFRSRGVQYRSIVDLLLQKCNSARSMDSLINKSSKVTRKQREQSDFAMFDNTTYKWDPKLTDEWLADRIVLCAKELAIADKKNETEAPLYYDRVKALTDLGRDEEKFITCCHESNLDAIKQKLPWTIQMPASPAITTTTG